MPDSSALNTIICPRCHAELQATSEVCGYCGASTRVEAVPAAGRAQRSPDQARLIERPFMMAIIVLHLGLFGIPLYWRSRYSYQARVALVVFSIGYTLFVAAAVVWGIGQMIRLFSAVSG